MTRPTVTREARVPADLTACRMGNTDFQLVAVKEQVSQVRHHPDDAVGQGAPTGRTGPTSGRHSPPKAGGGKDPQFQGGSLSAGIPAFGVIRTLEWQTPFAALQAPCLRPVKVDGNEPPAALRAAVPAPTGRTGRRSAFPCLRVAPLGGLGAVRHVQRPRGAFCDSASAPAGRGAGRRPALQTIPALHADQGWAAGLRTIPHNCATRVQRKNPRAGWPRGSVSDRRCVRIRYGVSSLALLNGALREVGEGIGIIRSAVTKRCLS